MTILKCLSIVLSHLDVEDKKIAHSSWIDVLQVLFDIGLVVRVCFASFWKTGCRFWWDGWYWYFTCNPYIKFFLT